MDRQPKQPLVSILVTFHNSSAYVAQTLDELLAQDYPKIEIIASDDCSTDDSVAICRRYAERHPDRVRLLVNARNVGLWGNMFRCLKEARGKYLVWCCAGDHWTPDFISRQVARLEAVPGAVACGCGIDQPHESGEGAPGATLSFGGPKAPENLAPVRAAISALIKSRSPESTRAHLGAMIHTMLAADKTRKAIESFDGCGLIMNERQVICQLALAGPLVHVDDVLFSKVLHSEHPSVRRPNEPSRILSQKKFYYTRAAGKLIWSLSRSQIVPWHRKLFIPVIIGSYLGAENAYILFVRTVAILKAILPEPAYRTLRQAYRRRRPA